MMKIFPLVGTISLIISIIAAKAADFWLTERIAVLGSFAGLKFSLNPGIAWGIRLPSGIQELAIISALIAVGYLAQSAETKLSKIAFGLILGGGFANVVDRFQDGYVTDYFQVGTFPIFNVADSCVTIGVGLLLLEAILAKIAVE